MFLILLGIATCDTFCLKPASGSCPEGIPLDNQIDTEANLLAKVVSAGTIIYTSVALTTAITDEKIKLISEIHNFAAADSNVAVIYEISTAFAIESLNVTKIELEVKNAGSLSEAVKLICNSLILNKEAAIKTGSTLTIKKLACSSLKAGNDAIGLTTTEIAVIGVDVVSTIEPDSTNVKLTDSATTGATVVSVLDTVTTVNIISAVTIKAAKLTVTGAALSGIKQNVNVNLTYGNQGETVIELIGASDATVSTKLKIYVDTYYKEGADYASIKNMFTLNDKYKLTDGNRVVPKAANYCLDVDFERKSGCPSDAQVLWKTTEVKSVNNGEELANIYVSGHDSSEVEVAAVADIKAKNIGFVGVTNQQKIKITSADATISITGEFLFNNIALNVEVPAAATMADVGFKKLTVLKSSIAAVKAATVGGSKSLRVDPTVAVVAEDLISDTDSFTNFKAEKPSNSLTLVGVAAATFEGDGSKVTAGSLQLPKEKIPEKFAIAVLSGTETHTTSLTITENTGGANKPVPFSLDVPAGSKLTLNYEGDWTGVEVIVNVAKDGVFDAKTTGDENKPPKMEAYGEGKAQINGEDIPKPAPPAGATPTPKGGLSGGAIAGIVIACVVVVAAVVVVVVVVIKKKKAKVAN